MNEKSKTEKTAFGLTEEKFCGIMEEQERLSKESFEDEALEQFVKEPEKSNLYDKVVSTTNFILLFFLFFYPLTCINEGFDPRSYLVVVYTVGRITGILPREDSTFQVRHHGQMASVCTGQSGY